MHVSIAIVGFRNIGDIVRCLAALAQSTYRDFDIVICENGGDEAFDAVQTSIAPTLPSGQPVRMVSAGGNIGFAGGVNRCLAEAPGADAWWVLNPDTQPDAFALERLVERLAVGDCDAVGCPVYLPDGRVQSYGGRWQRWLARSESIGHGSRIDTPPDPAVIEKRQSYLNGAAMLVSRKWRDRVGFMREDYFLYCEEVEWCLRGLALGLRLGYAGEAKVLHEQGATTGAGGVAARRPRLPVFLSHRNLMLLTRDRFPAALPLAAPAALAILVIHYVRRRAWRQLGYALSGWAAGLRDERGPPSWMSA